ncbi:MAG TPA: TIGR00159 family protein [Candidatus Merdiplasma excrementigallinarum]|uniref:Diadenylate cyclase n=1 Tax=Candidatus Merdiplasma excrementigallinarum TaxID=2840864 RepID=A0A9D1NZB0_9FIRM|nr:TIGR00159 family protein [Candidatus Merdiplasma excrementigallinarum]
MTQMGSLRSWITSHLTWLRFPTISITPTDILEIIILAFLVYKLLVWIKDSRAWTLLKGILTIVICVGIVYILQMDTLIYIVNHALTIVITAAVVVFQPELRKVLEQLGEKRFISSILPLDNMRSVQELFSDKTINELVKGTVEMAKVKTGALIVIEQNETLEEYERTGIKVDALLTSQLLINIFEHNTPLHDGAVIMRGDRITAATCYLPLSDNMNLSKELGTRHRAAVGISEVTDSLTIVVSEETGYISIAYRGELDRNVTADELRQRLTVLQNKSVVSRRFKLWKGRTRHEG